MVAIPYADLAPVCRDVFSILISPFLMHPISLIYSGDQHWGEQMAKRMPTSADYGPAQVLYEVTASGIDQDYIEDVLNSNRLRERTSDTRGDGIFDMECDLPFVYNGVTYTDCTDVDSSSSSGGVPWCSTKVDADSLQHITGHWGNCLPSPEELIQESSYSDQHQDYYEYDQCSSAFDHMQQQQQQYEKEQQEQLYHEKQTEPEPELYVYEDAGVMDDNDVQQAKIDAIFSKIRHNRASAVREALTYEEIDVTAVDARGNTMLHICCQNNLRKMASIVINAGCPINEINHKGLTPLDYCNIYNFPQLSIWLAGNHRAVSASRVITSPSHGLAGAVGVVPTSSSSSYSYSYSAADYDNSSVYSHGDDAGQWQQPANSARSIR